MKTITTHNDPLIQHIIELHEAKGRKTRKQFIAQGIRTVATLIEAGYVPLNIFITNSFLHSKQYIEYTVLLQKQTTIQIIKDSIMQKINTTTTPSGIIAHFSIPQQPSFGQLSSGIVLAMIQDPGNAGTLIRTAAAMNKKTVVFIDSVDPWNPKVVQASAGTIGLVNVFVMNFQTLLTHKKNIPLSALVARDGQSPNKTNLSDTLLIVGNEANGIPQQLIEQCDYKVTLAMPGKSESLNAAVAGSIALYLAGMD